MPGGDGAPECEMDQVGDEAAAVVRHSTPRTPTAAEIDEHEVLGHAVYRSWCAICVRSRGIDNAHHPAPQDREAAAPTISIDYCYAGQRDEEGMPMLVAKDSSTKMLWGTSVPEKGVNEFAVSYLAHVINEAGYRRLFLKSDGERSIVALKAAVRMRCGDVEILLQESPVGDHQANGAAEVAVRELKRQVRALKLMLEERFRCEFSDAHPLLFWMPRHAGFLISRFRIGDDGRTPDERRTGRRWRKPMMTFGERVLFKPVIQRRRKNDLEAKYEYGHFIGVNSRTSEFLVMTREGVKRGFSIRRLPLEERWSASELGELRGTPWDMVPRPQVEAADAPPLAVPAPAPAPVERDAAVGAGAPRALYVRQADVERFGYTATCPGCCDLQVGRRTTQGGVRAHSDECREHIATKLLGDPVGRARVERAQKRKPSTDLEAVAAAESVADGAAASEAVAVPCRSEQEEMRVDPPENVVAEHFASAASGSQPSEFPPQEVGMARGQKRQASVGVEELDAGRRGDEGAPELGVLTHGKYYNGFCGWNRFAQDKLSALGFDDQMRRGVAFDLCRLGLESPDVMEVFSPPRFTAEAQLFGLRPGLSIDLETRKRNGDSWDLTQESDLREVLGLIRSEEPWFVTGGPPCESFSSLQRLSAQKGDPDKKQSKRERGEHLLKAAVRCYLEQYNSGRYFLHEHPKGADSWSLEVIRRVSSKPGVYQVSGPMCRWGLEAEDSMGSGYVRKETMFLTNSSCLAEILQGVCSNKEGHTWHRHVALMNGRAHYARRYPPQFVRGVLQAMRRQLELDGRLSSLASLCSGPVPEEKLVEDPDEFEEAYQCFYDDVTGCPLDPEQVRQARLEEIAWMRSKPVWSEVPRRQALERTGRPPISTRWVDVNKGDEQKPVHRSRLVVREIKRKGEQTLPDHALFASMPPLEALKTLCSVVTSVKFSTRGKPLKMRNIDVKKAHTYGKPAREVYIELPSECESPAGVCGLLNYVLYGCQDAAARWEEEYTSTLVARGFVQGKSSASVFYHSGMDVRLLIHGDDFVGVSDEDGLAYLEDTLAEKYAYKASGTLGWGKDDVKVLCVLNRYIRIEGDLLIYEPDPRHAELMIKGLGLEIAKGVTTPAVKMTQQQADADAMMEKVDPDLHSSYRSFVMRAAYLAQDRPDLAEAV